MPLVPIDLDGAGRPDPQMAQHLAARLRAHPPEAPVIVMIHGYKFSPRDPRHNPHRHILSLAPDRPGPRVRSWPQALGAADTGPRAPLCIALGWEARGSLWQAGQRAGAAGRGLAGLLGGLPGGAERPVHLLAHSLGARVGLSALPHLRAGALGRMVLLNPAEIAPRAQRMLDTPAGQRVQVVSVTSAENRVYDAIFAALMAPLWPGTRTLGGAGAVAHPAWVDLRLDRPGALAALAGLGLPVAPRQHWLCHWSPYLRPGVFGLYRAILGGDLDPRHLAQALAQAEARRPAQGPTGAGLAQRRLT